MVNQHLEDCRREGKSIERSYKGSFNVRISSELHKKAVLTARSMGISLNQLVKRALKREVESS